MSSVLRPRALLRDPPSLRRRRRRAKSESDTYSPGRALGGGDVGEMRRVASLLGGDGIGGGCPQAGESVAEHVGVGVVSAIDGVEAAGPLGMTFARCMLQGEQKVRDIS